MFGRSKPTQTHAQLLTEELAESYGHLKRAAGHAAGGAAEKLTPPYDRARNVAVRGWSSTKGAFAPLYVQVRQGATTAREEKAVARKRKSRWSSLFGLLAAGVAVGAAGALVSRRRRASQQWESYEPAAAEEPYPAKPSAGGPEGGGEAGTAGGMGTTAGTGPSTGTGPVAGASAKGGSATVADAAAEPPVAPPAENMPSGPPRERPADRPRASRSTSATSGTTTGPADDLR